jgi:hypothetical protein
MRETLLLDVPNCQVLAFLVGRELLSPEWAERILSWRHTGFSVHSRVWAKTKPEAERVGKCMICSVLSLERLTFLETEGADGRGRPQARSLKRLAAMIRKV